MGSSPGPAAWTGSSGSCCRRGGHRGRPLICVICCFSGAGAEVTVVGESLSEVSLVWHPCVRSISFSWTVSPSSCLRFWKGLALLRGVEKSRLLFSRFRSVPLGVCDGGRRVWAGSGDREKSCVSCRYGTVRREQRDPSSPGRAASPFAVRRVPLSLDGPDTRPWERWCRGRKVILTHFRSCGHQLDLSLA